jgi:stage II sporulation protein D
VLVCCVLVVASACSSRGEPIATPAPTAVTPSADFNGFSGARVTIKPPRDGSFLVNGLYPKTRSHCKRAHRGTLHARYPGALSVRSADDGTLSVVVTLPFERYLEGIAEVPPSWPAAALEAQAVAARSYALAHIGWTGQQGETVPKPICATSSCQVYGGLPVPPTRDFRRWVAAVQRTQGKVLLYGERPADTVYFSTSNGHTYGNDTVFGSDPLPYLRPVVEHDDGASPTAHWRVSLPFPDLAAFLRADGSWPEGVRISSVRREGATVRVAGPGTARSIDAGAFRDTVNAWALCLMPARYPTGGLPTTMPSDWYDVTSGPLGATVTGRGWGHGAGMVQWGAYGKATRGWSAHRILAYYYGGLQPTAYPEPGLIHVVVAEGVQWLVIKPSAHGATIDGARLPRGPVRITGDAGIVTVTPT